jgi:hypothetical protein
MRIGALVGIALLLTIGTAAAGHIPTRAQALSRPGKVTKSGTTSSPLKTSGTNKTFDLRKWTYKGAMYSSSAAISLAPGDRAATVGGRVLGSYSRTIKRGALYDQTNSAGIRVEGNDWMATWNLRVNNWWDGYRPRSATNRTTHWLLEDAHFSYIRDDAIENDEVMSGKVRDSLFDDVFMAFSNRPSASSSACNSGAVLRLNRVLVHLSPMPHEEGGADGLGHGQLFKWEGNCSGKVYATNSIFFVEEVSTNGRSSMDFPAGTYSDNVVVLGRAFDGDGDGSKTDRDYPGLPAKGVTQTRDTSRWTKARNAWIARH